jgi:hypothetical protein
MTLFKFIKPGQMKKLEQLMKEIIQLSANMESNYPELHQHLTETPMILGDPGKEISTADLESYLHTLKEQLHNYMKTHGVKKI